MSTKTKDAPTNGTSAATAPVAPPAFISRPITVIPKREPPKNEPDMATANAILAIVTGTTEVDGEKVANTATNGEKYADAKIARQAANKAKRALTLALKHSTEVKGKIAKSRVWGDPPAVEWAVFLADEPPAAPAAAETPAPATGA